MTRARIVLAVSAAILACSVSISADVRADEKTRVEFAGMLGKFVNFFGGKSAREGVTSIVAVKGDRKATLNDSTGQIIDLAEEKIYDLDLKKKTYKVTTFAELRRRMEEARKKAEEDARKEQAAAQESKPEESKATQEKPPEMQIDIDVKETGQKKNLNGFDTRQVVITATAHEKGKTVEQAGGLVMAMDTWLAPKIAAMNEIAQFDLRYAQKLYGSMLAGVSAEQMATAMALYPMMKDVVGKVNTEGAKMDGTAILTTTTIEAAKSAEQMAQEAKQQSQQNQEDSKVNTSGGISGALGGFARRAARKKTESEPKPRTTIMTATNEVLKVTTDVTAADVAPPAGFKESK